MRSFQFPQPPPMRSQACDRPSAIELMEMLVYSYLLLTNVRYPDRMATTETKNEFIHELETNEVARSSFDTTRERHEERRYHIEDTPTVDDQALAIADAELDAQDAIREHEGGTSATCADETVTRWKQTKRFVLEEGCFRVERIFQQKDSQAFVDERP